MLIMYICVTGVLDKVPNTVFTKRKKGLWKTIPPVTLVPHHCFTEEGPPGFAGRLNCSVVRGTVLAQFTQESQSGSGGEQKLGGFIYLELFCLFNFNTD